MKHQVEEIEKILETLEHDRTVHISVLERTKKIISSEKGLLGQHKEIELLEKVAIAEQRADFKEYPGMIEKAEHAIRALKQESGYEPRARGYQKRLDDLKKFYEN